METRDLKKIFRFFDGLPEEDLDHFVSFCQTRQVPAGTMLWEEGNDDNYAAYILSGKVGIKKKTEFEGKHVFVGTNGKGSVIGELCLLTHNPRSVGAEVIEPAELLILTSDNFERLITQHPMLGLNLLKNIFITTSRRLRKSYDRIASIF